MKPLVALMVGGPKAGMVLLLHEADQRRCIRFPVLRQVAHYWNDDASLQLTPEPLLVLEYRPRSRMREPLETAEARVVPFDYVGEDKIRVERTNERVVGFNSPYGVQELRDKTEVEWLLFSCGVPTPVYPRSER